MSFAPHVIWNNLERVTSDDLTRAGLLASSALMDVLVGLATGPSSGAPSQVAPAVVLRGLLLSTASGMNVSLAVGTILRYSTTSIPTDGSAYRLGVLRSAATLLLTSDPTLPRVARISIAEVSEDADTTNRDIYDEVTQQFTSTPVAKTRRATSTVTITLGTPAANPVAPATPAGGIPLWDVFIPAAAVTIDGTHFMDLRVPFSSGAERARVERTGLNTYAPASGGTTVGVGTGQLKVRGDTFDFAGQQFVTATDDLLLGAAPAANTTYYMYAIGRSETTPVGLSLVGGLAFVLSTVAPDDVYGQPTGSINYAPLQTIVDQASGGPLASTTRAYCVGTMLTDGSGNFRYPSSGPQLGNNPFVALQMCDPATGGFDPVQNFWLRQPLFEWIAVDQVRCTNGLAVIRGIPHQVISETATIPAALVSGEVEAPSTWFYLYARLETTFSVLTAGKRRIVMRLSTQAPNSDNGIPTPESGFVSGDYIYVGSVWNDSGSDFKQFVRVGTRYRWLRPEAINYSGTPTLATSPTRTTITAIVPSTAQVAEIRATLAAYTTSATAGSILSSMAFWHRTGGTGSGDMAFNLSFHTHGSSGDRQNQTAVFDMMLTSGVFEGTQVLTPTGPTAASVANLDQLGYDERAL